MRSRTSPVAALLFGSGFCALVYQVGWLREFRLIFGASTAASAAVLAIFIIAAVISPGTDVVSQCLMAGPMLALYGFSILVAWIFAKRRDPESD